MAKRTSKQERPLPKGCSLTAVAKRAGVSITTVSFVLNGKSASIKIAEATRRKVIEVARELNYRPRVPRLYDAQIAPLFRHIGLAFVNALGQEVHEFFGPAVYEILNRAGKEGVLIHSCDGLAPEEVAGYCAGLRERDCDGLILFTFSTEREAWVDDVRASGIPFVFFNRDFGPDIPCVLMDHAGCAASQAALLAKHGHRRIGLFETVLPGPAYERLDGARAGLRKAGVYDAALEFAAPYDLEAASGKALEFLSAHPEVTAVLGTTDIVSMGVLRAAARLGRRVPADLSVASMDGYEPGRYADPPLCSIEYPRVRMGQEALELLRERVLNGAVSAARRIVSGERLPGRSVAPPGANS